MWFLAIICIVGMATAETLAVPTMSDVLGTATAETAMIHRLMPLRSRLLPLINKHRIRDYQNNLMYCKHR